MKSIVKLNGMFLDEDEYEIKEGVVDIKGQSDPRDVVSLLQWDDLSTTYEHTVCNIPPRCMMSTITPDILEKINKQQYENFITSCIHGGQFDAIVSYKEWLSTIQSYKPQLPQTNVEYDLYWQKLRDVQNLTRIPITTLKEMFPEKMIGIRGDD